MITTCPHQYDDTFEYQIINNNTILVERTDNPCGWWLDLHVKVNDAVIRIGRSPSNRYKLVELNHSLYDVEVPPAITPIKFTARRSGAVHSSNLITNETFNFDGDNLVVITSLINIVSSSGAHHSSRDRFGQTIEQLKSVATFIPDCKIVVLEQSKTLPREMQDMLLMHCDHLVLYGEDETNNYYSNEQTLNKGLGEMYATLHFCDTIKSTNFLRMFKIVGRYILTSDFEYKKFNTECPTFKVMKGDGRLNIIVFTNLYTIPRKYIASYCEHIRLWLGKTRAEPVEHIMTMFAESVPDLKLVARIGMYGFGGNSGELCHL